MPAVARQGDANSTGHGCDSVTTITGPTGATAHVYANNIPVECKGNPTVVHSVPGGSGCVSHSAVINTGSSNVFVSDIPLARVTDSTDNGQILPYDQPSVFVNS